MTSVNLHEGVEGFRRVRRVWHEIEHRADVRPFQACAWAEAWLATLGADSVPWILEIGDPCQALVPFVLNRKAGVRTLSLLGDGVSDYLEPVAWVGADEETLAKIIAHWLRTHPHRFDFVDLKSLSVGSPAVAALEALLPGSIRRPYERCPVVDTTGTWDEFLATRTRKFRANIKRAKRRVASYGAVEVGYAPVDSNLLHEMLDVERDSWKWKSGRAYLKPLAKRKFLGKLLIECKLPHELWTCRIDGTVASFALVLLGTATRYYYLPSFRARFPDVGSFLLGEIVRDSFGSSFNEFDLLQGDEPYKMNWATGERMVQELAYGRGPAGTMAILATRARWRLARSRRVRAIWQRLTSHGWF